MKRILSFWVVFGLLLTQAWAAAPTWTVNPSAYDYNMTMTAILNVACEELENPSNMLGAFVGNDLRGVATSSSVIEGRYMTLITIYSNISSGETVEFKIYNADTDQTYDTKTPVTFQDDAVFGTPSIPFIVKTNNEPTNITLSDTSIVENQVTGTLIGNLSTVDIDNDVYTYSLVTGIGSDHNANVQISTAALQSNIVFDYETQETQKIRIKADDGQGCSYEKAFEIRVKNANDIPTDIAISAFQIDENNKVGAEIGMFSTVDDDENSTHIYSLVTGTGDDDNATFTIVGDVLKAGKILDFETQENYKIRVQTDDGQGGTYQKEFIISALDINDKPTALNLDVKTITENNKIGATIGILSTTDQDANDTHSYAFSDIPGNNNDQFFIVGNQLKAAKSFDFESLNEFYIYVTTYDSEQESFTQLLVITVIDGNDAPTAIIVSNSSISENQPVKTFITKIATTDPDDGQTHVYSLSNGIGDIDNGSFLINNDSLFSNAVFEVAVKDEFSIRIQTDDQNGATYSEQFSIFVKDVNNDPTDIYLSNTLVLESEPLGTMIGNFTTADADLGDGHTYSLVAGIGSDDNASFTIFGNEIKSNTTFDFETKEEYKIRVQTNDGFGGLFAKEFVIKVTNGNDDPTDIALSNNEINENESQGTLIGAFTTTDLDVGDSHTYALIEKTGADNDQFVIVGNELKTSAIFDFETKDTYVINVMTDDGKGGTFTKQFIINVNDQNDAPHLIETTSDEVQEEQPIGTIVGTLSTEDVDAVDSHTYALVTGKGSDHNASFEIDGTTLKTTAVFDISVQTEYKIRIRTTDAKGETYAQAFVIKVIDVNDAPKDITLSNNLIAENLGINTLIGSFTSTDDDPLDTHTYSLVAGIGDTSNSSFLITGNELKTKAIFDYEAKNSYSIRVETNDGKGGTYQEVFEIQITDANDKPTNISFDNLVVTENEAIGTTVAKITTTDQDATDSYVYSFVDTPGNNNDQFLVFGDELKTNVIFDYEDKSLFFVSVRSTDASGEFIEKQFTISIADSNDAPLNITLSNQSIDEHKVVGSFVGFFSTEDVDATDSHTYSLVNGVGGDDNASFEVDGSQLKSNEEFVYNTKNLYSVLVQTEDKGGETTQQIFQISINDVNDLPTAIYLSSTSIDEGASVGTFIAKLSTEDVDVTDTHTYSLVSGTGGNDNNEFKVVNDSLFSNDIFDYEDENLYSIRIQTKDSQGGSFEQAFEISVEDVNEKPVLLEETFTIQESAELGVSLGTIKALDSDDNQTMQYEIVKNDSIKNLPFKVDLLSGELVLNATNLDYENDPTYTFEVKVTDDGTPALSDVTTITVNVLDEIEGFLPSTDFMSPNGDEMNDTWQIDNVDLYADYELTIFNGNGEIVYEVSNNYQNDWDGTYNGTDLPAGAYYYLFRSTAEDGKVFKGTISLVR